MASGCPGDYRNLMNSPNISTLEGLFRRWPALVGFTVQDAETLSGDRDWVWLDEGLALADVGLQDWISPKHELEIMADVATALRDLIAESPQAEELLRGHTFARTLH